MLALRRSTGFVTNSLKRWKSASPVTIGSNETIPRVSLDSVNQHVKVAEYAVRGPIVSKSLEYKQKLQSKSNELPFSEIIESNIGNPHALRQAPITFMRDVLSCVVNPSLMDRAPGAFNEDVRLRAKKYLDAGNRGVIGMGAYTESRGMVLVREEISTFLEKRDGFAANIDNIFVTNGASAGVSLCMNTLIQPGDGILTPIPQYPLYSAATALYDANLIPYYLDESAGWAASVDKLQEGLDSARSSAIATKALVVINPGNPTGQVMKEEDMISVINFCVRENLVLMADEVYQENIYKEGAQFHSFRKVAKEMGVLDLNSGKDENATGLQLISFHSISKGFLGECGLRGGYFELYGFPKSVIDEIYKLASTGLCSNTIGQIATGLMVNPPVEGDASFDQYKNEKDAILSSLHRRATKSTIKLNELPGIECQEIEGALYAFPTIHLPPKAVEYAQAHGMAPDAFYCEKLLDNTGIVVVPGSGFKQVEGTFHFRTTILPPEEQLDRYFTLLGDFHSKFMQEYS